MDNYPSIYISDCSTSSIDFDPIFPIGCIEITMGIDPGLLYFDTVWEQISQGRMIMGEDGSTYNNGDEGGSEEHTFTEAQLPSHDHTFPTGVDYTYDYVQLPAHSHSCQSGNDSGGHTHGDFAEKILRDVASGYLERGGAQKNIYRCDRVGSSSSGHSHTNGSSGYVGDSAHVHSISGDFTTPSGAAVPHKRMPPYFVVTIWKRIS